MYLYSPTVPITMSLSKFSLCVLMTQCGKTFVSIDHMIRQLRESEDSLYVVYTMNTLLNNEQFAKRLHVIEETYGPNSVMIFSSKYKGTYQHVKKLEELKTKTAIITPRVVIMCSHHKRFTEGHQWIEHMNTIRPDVPIHIVYDELHQYIKASLRRKIEKVHDLDSVKSIMALSATPQMIIQKRGRWETIRMVTHASLNLDGYASVADMQFHAIDNYFYLPYVKPVFNDFARMDEETIGFMEHVLDAHPEILAVGNRVFLPAHVRRQGHIVVRDVVLERNPNAVVVILNAMEKSLVYEDDEGEIQKVILRSTGMEEVCERIASVMSERKLDGRTLVITGFLCVGMGQTLTHQSMGNFTHSIISHMGINNDAIYQLFGRVTGRVKHWDTYQPTKLYCPTQIYNRVKVMETCAAEVIKHLMVDKEIYKRPMLDMPEGMDVIENERVVEKTKVREVIVIDDDDDYEEDEEEDEE